MPEQDEKEPEQGDNSSKVAVINPESEQLTVEQVVELMKVASMAFDAINFVTAPVIDPGLDYIVDRPDENASTVASQTTSSFAAGAVGTGLGYLGYISTGALAGLSTPALIGVGALYGSFTLIAMNLTARAAGRSYQYLFGEVDISMAVSTFTEVPVELNAISEEGKRAIQEGAEACQLLINAIPQEMLETIDKSSFQVLSKILLLKQDKLIKSKNAVISELSGAPNALDMLSVINAITQLSRTVYTINQCKNRLNAIKQRTELALNNIESGIQAGQASSDLQEYLSQPGADFGAIADSLRESMGAVTEQLKQLDVFSGPMFQVINATEPFRMDFSKGLSNHLALSSHQLSNAIVNTIILSGEQYGRDLSEFLSTNIISIGTAKGIPIMMNQGASFALQMVSNMLIPGSGGVVKAAAGPFMAEIRAKGEKELGVQSLDGTDDVSKRIGVFIDELNAKTQGHLLPVGVTGATFAATYFAGVGLVGGGILATGATTAAVTNPTIMGGMARGELVKLLKAKDNSGRDAADIIADIIQHTTEFLLQNTLQILLNSSANKKLEHEASVGQSAVIQQQSSGPSYSYQVGRMASQALATELQTQLNAYGHQHFGQDIAYKVVDHSVSSSITSSVTSVVSSGLSFLWGSSKPSGPSKGEDDNPSPSDNKTNKPK